MDVWRQTDIREQIEGTQFAGKLELMLAAFAYAAKLERERGTGQRVSRACHDRNQRSFKRIALALETMLDCRAGSRQC
jgi:hypothetical protein